MDAYVAPRPLNLGGIIAATLRVYLGNYLTFVVILAIYQVPLAIWGVALQAMPDLVCLWGLLFLPIVVVAMLSPGALVSAAGQGYAEDRVDLLSAYRQALSRLFSIIGASILVGIVAILLSITVIGIPVAIYFGVRWSMYMCAIMLEGRGARGALSRSTDLVRGSWWRVFGILLVLGLTLGIISFLVGAVLGIVAVVLGIGSSPVFTAAGGVLVGILIGAFTLISQVVLFYDLRTRKEGLNVGPTDDGPPVDMTPTTDATLPMDTIPPTDATPPTEAS